jgi:DNA polymerase III subunit epsilon
MPIGLKEKKENFLMKKNQGFAVIDLETTGLDYHKGDKIIQIAVVHLNSKGEKENEWVTYVNPNRKLAAQHIHNIEESDVAGQPDFKTLAPKIMELFENRVIVAHNYKFDGFFLEREFAEAGIKFDAEKTLHFCTKDTAIHFLPNILNHTLSACMKEYGIEFTGTHHEALNDAVAAANIFQNYLNGNKKQVMRLINFDE